MENTLKRRNDESLHQWISRIAPRCKAMEADEIHEVLTEVSRVSYTEGVHVTMKPYYGD